MFFAANSNNSVLLSRCCIRRGRGPVYSSVAAVVSYALFNIQASTSFLTVSYRGTSTAGITALGRSLMLSPEDSLRTAVRHRGSSLQGVPSTVHAESGAMSGVVGVTQPPKFKLAACQILCTEDKKENIDTARKAIEDAAEAGAQIVVLPECWNCPYDTSSFPVYAEPVPEPGGTAPQEEESPSTSMLCKVAAEKKVYLIGGSVPEAGEDGGIYNTCVIAGPEGQIMAKHRKVHLFDIDVDGIKFKESDALSPGNTITTVETPYGVIGVGICYDIRFPELSMAMRAAGAVLLCFPGAFNMTTGPAHWELLQRSRAVDNQCFVVTASPARNPKSKYQAWGHSSIVDPWGSVVATTEHDAAMVTADVDIGQVQVVRCGVPISLQKRSDLYRLELMS